VLVCPVGPDAGKRGKNKGGKLADEAHDSQQEYGIGHSVDKPAYGNLLHPGARKGYELSGKEKPVIAGPQRAKGKSKSPGYFSRRFAKIHNNWSEVAINCSMPGEIILLVTQGVNGIKQGSLVSRVKTEKYPDQTGKAESQKNG